MGRKLFIGLNIAILVLCLWSFWYIENGWSVTLKVPLMHMVILLGTVVVVPIILAIVIHNVFAVKFDSSEKNRLKYYTIALVLYAVVSMPYIFNAVFAIMWTVAGLGFEEYLAYAIPLALVLAIYIGTYTLITMEYLGKVDV